MHVPALALLSRTLRVELRRRRTHLYRLAFVGLIFFAMVVAEATSLTLGAPGLTFFRGITYFNFACLTLAGIGYFATAITEEKDEQTIGILKMAGIGPLGLLLGKSTSRLITTLLILAVQLPFTFLAVTLGGITPEQILATYLALAAYTVLLANLGLVCSVAFRGSALATGAAGVLIGLMHLTGPLAHELIAVASGPTAGRVNLWDSAIDALRDFSVLWRLEPILASRFAGDVWSRQITLNLIAGAALFLMAWWCFEWFTQEQGRVRWRWLAGLTRGADQGRKRRSRRAWSRALLWKEFSLSLGGWPAVAFKALLFSGLVVGTIYYVEQGRSMGPDEWVNASSVGVVLGILAIVTEQSVYASLLFRTDVRQRTLPLLVLLPVSTGHLGRTKAAAMLLQALPACGVIILSAAVHPNGLISVASDLLDEPMAWMVILQFIVFLHLTVWLSLFVRWGALPLAILLVYVLTYTLGWCCVFPVAISLSGFPYSPGPRDLAALVVPMVLVALGIVVLLQFAIAERLRTLAGR